MYLQYIKDGLLNHNSLSDNTQYVFEDEKLLYRGFVEDFLKSKDKKKNDIIKAFRPDYKELIKNKLWWGNNK